jgi:hypothetical protein
VLFGSFNRALAQKSSESCPHHFPSPTLATLLSFASCLRSSATPLRSAAARYLKCCTGEEVVVLVYCFSVWFGGLYVSRSAGNFSSYSVRV